MKKNIPTTTIKRVLQHLLNLSLVLLSITLVYLLGKELFNIVYLAIMEPDNLTHKNLLQSILTFFLYFEFLAMIVKYFKENYHFPLRYFMYIGITATIRYIVVDHDDAIQTLYISASILLLVISYAIITLLSIAKKKTGFDD